MYKPGQWIVQPCGVLAYKVAPWTTDVTIAAMGVNIACLNAAEKLDKVVDKIVGIRTH